MKLYNKIFTFLTTYKYTITITLTVVVVGSGILGVIDHFRKTLRDGQITDYIIQSNAARDKGDYLEAFNYLQKAHELDPSDPDIYYREANVAFLNGDYTVALSLYVKSGKPNPAASIYYATLEQVANFNYDVAISRLKEQESQFSPTTLPTDIQTTSLFEKINTIKTIDNIPLQKAQTAKLLLDEKASELALSLLQQLITDYPYYRDAHYLLGLTEYMRGEFLNAKNEFQRVLDIDPNFEPAREYLVKLSE